jgi:nuclear cap-binding protein subunit 1
MTDIVSDTIHLFSLNHTECSRLLLDIGNKFNKQYITKKGYVVYEAVVEGIFTQLLTFPVVLEKSVYYSTLLMDLCRTSIDKVPSIFGRIMRTIYGRLDNDGCMDVQAINRISELFAHHLGNFGFSWKWVDWEDCLKVPHTNGKFIFIRETLERCIRLAYYDRIKNSVPESYIENGFVFPPNTPSSNFEYASLDTCDNKILIDFASTLNNEILARSEEDKIKDILLKVEKYSFEIEPMQEPAVLSRKMLIQCIMFQGSKSFSHILSVIEKYLPLLQQYNESSEARLETVVNVTKFWKQNTQFMEIILDKLVNYRIIDPKSIILYMVSPEIMETNYSRFYVLSILKNTIVKVNLKAQQVEMKLTKAKAENDISVGNKIHYNYQMNLKILMSRISQWDSKQRFVKRKKRYY